ncbi:MAG: MFS transporter [Bacteroidetes bacterium]|nr:MAG: MFS transporter [Bacteroidota bacterium]
MNKSDSEKIRSYHVILFVICFLGTALAGTVSTLMAVYLPVAVKELLGETDAGNLNNISAYISAVFIFGGSIGGFIAGMIGDRWGRKTSVIFSIGCYSIFTILTGIMSSWQEVVVCRFFSGFGLGGVLVSTTTIMIEEWPQKTKAIFLGILSISIPVGIFSAGAIEYLIPSWRKGFQIGILPLIVALISMWLLKESNNWEKYNEERILEKRERKNLFASDFRFNLLIGSIIFGTMLIGLWAIFSWLPTWIQTLIVSGDGQKERGLSMMMLGMGGLIGGFLSGWLMNAIGIYRSLILCFAASAILSFVLFKTNSTFSYLILIEIGIMALFFGASQGVLSVYIPNLFPVNIRSTATGFCFNTGRVVTAIAVLFIGFLVSFLGGYGNSLLIFSSVFAIGLLVILFTKQNKSSTDPLPDKTNSELADESAII